MASSASRHYQLAQRLLKSLHGTRVLPLSSENLDDAILETPRDFHAKLCQSISGAQDRISLASLYIGTGAGPKEAELLQSICQSNVGHKTRILMDANRGTRPVETKEGTTTSAALAVQEAVEDKIHLYQPLQQPLSSLPTPLNEAMGVFHLKSYITDDTLILSGANLSQEYFTDRQDRYIRFKGGELVDFYEELVEILIRNANEYPADNNGGGKTENRMDNMLESLANLFGPSSSDDNNANNDVPNDDVVAYAIPTFGHPNVSLPFASDTQQISNLLTATSQEEDCHLNLASAYLNPTPQFLELLQKQQPDCTLLTAGSQSHGFAPKPGVQRRGDFVPKFFAHQSQQLVAEQKFHLLFYNRPGWTFHAKGLWIVSKEGNLVAAVVGSGNYGYRSEQRDVESNLVLIFPNETSKIQEALLQEWQRLCEYAEDPILDEQPPVEPHVRAIWPWIQSFF